jgi:hypothetical protein
MDPQIKHAHMDNEKALYAHDSPRDTPRETWDPKVLKKAELLADMVVTSTCTMLCVPRVSALCCRAHCVRSYLLSFLDRANIVRRSRGMPASCA